MINVSIKVKNDTQRTDFYRGLFKILTSNSLTYRVNRDWADRILSIDIEV